MREVARKFISEGTSCCSIVLVFGLPVTYEVVQDDGTPREFIDLIHRSVSIPPGLAWNLRRCLSCSASLSCFALIIVVLLRCSSYSPGGWRVGRSVLSVL